MAQSLVPQSRRPAGSATELDPVQPHSAWQVLASAIRPSINHTLTVGSVGGGRCAWQTRGTAGTPRPAGQTGPAAGLLQSTKAQLPGPLHRLGWHTGQSAAGPSPAGPALRRHPCSMQRASCQISCCPDTRIHCMARCKAAALPGLRCVRTLAHSRWLPHSTAGVPWEVWQASVQPEERVAPGADGALQAKVHEAGV